MDDVKRNMKKQCIQTGIKTAASTAIFGRTIEEAVRGMWNRKRKKESEHAHPTCKLRFVIFFSLLLPSRHVHTRTQTCTYVFTNALSLTSQYRTTELTGSTPSPYTRIQDKRLNLCQHCDCTSISLNLLELYLYIHRQTKKKTNTGWSQ